MYYWIIVFLLLLGVYYTNRIEGYKSNIIKPYFFYINLKSRKDRKYHIVRQLRRIGVSPRYMIRINAIAKSNGHLGCALSHLKVLDYIQRHQIPVAFVLEDDFTWRKNPEYTRKKIKDLLLDPNWEICLLACNGTMKPFNSMYSRVVCCQTTSGYMIRLSYVPILYRFWKSYIDNKQLNNNVYDNTILVNGFGTAIDQSWKILQQRHPEKWIASHPLLGKQKNIYDSATFKYGSSLI
jgi:hypothetical protein